MTDRRHLGPADRRGHRLRRSACWLLAPWLVLAACSGRQSVPRSGAQPPATEATAADGSVVSKHAGEQWFLGEVPAMAVQADDTLTPIKLGMINQENTPVGSYAEVRAAVQAAAAWVNAELGGIDGHPVEIDTCITTFDPERSRACAIELVERGVVALVGGVDVTSHGSYPVIEQTGLASFGGIPANLVEQRSPNAFFFSGGDAGALAGFMAHASENGRIRVALAYAAEVDSFEVAARDYGAVVGESLGLEVALIPFSLFATDYRPVIAEAQARGADALMVLAATAACVPVMQSAADLGLEAQLYLTGACAGSGTIDAAGEMALGVIWNAEGSFDRDDTDGRLFFDVIERYAEESAGGAGTVGFRGFMNLYALLLDAGADNATSGALAELARAAVDRPSFWGHPYTCDGDQVPGLQALCAPQQTLFELPQAGGEFYAATNWIPTDELFTQAWSSGD